MEEKFGFCWPKIDTNSFFVYKSRKALIEFFSSNFHSKNALIFAVKNIELILKNLDKNDVKEFVLLKRPQSFIIKDGFSPLFVCLYQIYNLKLFKNNDEKLWRLNIWINIIKILLQYKCNPMICNICYNKCSVYDGDSVCCTKYEDMQERLEMIRRANNPMNMMNGNPQQNNITTFGTQKHQFGLKQLMYFMTNDLNDNDIIAGFTRILDMFLNSCDDIKCFPLISVRLGFPQRQRGGMMIFQMAMNGEIKIIKNYINFPKPFALKNILSNSKVIPFEFVDLNMKDASDDLIVSYDTKYDGIWKQLPYYFCVSSIFVKELIYKEKLFSLLLKIFHDNMYFTKEIMHIICVYTNDIHLESNYITKYFPNNLLYNPKQCFEESIKELKQYTPTIIEHNTEHSTDDNDGDTKMDDGDAKQDNDDDNLAQLWSKFYNKYQFRYVECNWESYPKVSHKQKPITNKPIKVCLYILPKYFYI